MVSWLGALALLLSRLVPASGAILHVPGNYGNIAAAVAAAAPGDTILVADGVYSGPGNSDIDALGKAITLQSANGPSGCILDLQSDENNQRRAFHFHSGEGSDTAVVGFTIRGGWALHGGAILCEDGSSPRIENCNFELNRAWEHGGAIATFLSGPSVVGCTFQRNRAGLAGGCVRHCCWRGGGAGIAVVESTPTILNSTFLSNGCNGGGAAINVTVPDPNYPAPPFPVLIANCVMVGNATENGPGAGVAIRAGDVTILNSTIVGNHCHCLAAGVATVWEARVTLSGCTIRLGHSNLNDGEYVSVELGAQGSIAYCDVEGGEVGVYVDEYSTMNWGGGLFDADPLFVRRPDWGEDGRWGTEDDDLGDVHLTAGSPCMDTGDPLAVPPGDGLDCDGLPRIQDGDGDGTPWIDVGAFEFGAATGLPGDVDGNCVVNLADLTVLLANFGTQSGATPEQGDLDGDGAVRLGDLTILLAHFGESC